MKILFLFLIGGVAVISIIAWSRFNSSEKIIVDEQMQRPQEVDSDVIQSDVVQEPIITVTSLSPLQADTVFIRVQFNQKPSGIFDNKTVDFFEISSNNWMGIVGIDVKAKEEAKPFVIHFENATSVTQTFTIQKQRWPITKLAVNKELADKGYTPETISKNIVENENAIIGAAMSIYRAVPYFSGKFIDPLDKRIVVGAYGNIRQSGSVSLQHLGIDLDGEKGDRVYAINDAIVTLSREGLPNYGTTVILDHGLGIFSLYLHLDKTNVVVGQKVARGEIIGFVGNTGYSLSPHLHFSMRVPGASIDPIKFIDMFNSAIQ